MYAHTPLSLCWSCLNHRGVDPSQKPQYCIVYTIHTPIHTHLHTHIHKAVTLRSPVNSLQCLLSSLCRHCPKRQCCVQLIPLFGLCWRPLVRAVHCMSWGKKCFICAHVWVCHTHYRPPLCLPTLLIFICINLIVCLGSVSPLWIPPLLPNTICLAVCMFSCRSPLDRGWPSHLHNIHTCAHTQSSRLCV